jgi:two-component system, NtrC family, sensor kinase
VSGKAVGRTAAALPWLCPNTDSLIRLAEAPAGLGRLCFADPALLSFLHRFAPPASHARGGPFCPSGLVSATLPDLAATLLRANAEGWVPPDCEVARRCGALVAGAAPLARRIAEHTGRVCADRASSAVILAPLGWYAIAAHDSAVAAEPFHDPEQLPVASVQTDRWGLDQNAIARRLANRWRFPDWLATTLGNLNLPLSAARGLIADPELFAVVQLALIEAEHHGPNLCLTRGADRGILLKELNLDAATLDRFRTAPVETPEPDRPSAFDANPHKVPLLPNLLKMAVESRRRTGAALVSRLEDRLDDLHRAIGHIGIDAEQRARDAKLTALAELAAGAGHEINNPLAVISGNAQRLFRTEPDPDRGQALQTVIRQTQRIAGIVRDLMQFARPPRPNPHRVAVGELLAAVREELAPFAAEKRAQLTLSTAPADAFIRCDFAQLKTALGAVVRNGIEAAGPEGWVRIACSEGDDEFICFTVEDSGSGLSGASLEHCFDPFYCGRSAGRGRGLGLPTAWQLVRQNGGEVRYEPTPDGPTRFVVTVPRSVTLEFLDRRSA